MLPSSGFLSHASKDLRDLMGRAASEVSLKNGEILFEQGDDGDTLYAVTKGAIELSVISREGRKLSLDVLRPGDMFGEIALFDPNTRTAGAVAIGDTTLLSVRNADPLRELRGAPELAVDLVRLAGQRMRWMSKQLSEQVFLPMPSRLARKIMHLTAHGDSEHPVLDMSQADLAEFVGATREAVSKTLSAWKSRGVIESTRGGLKIIDYSALEALGELDDI